MLASSVRVRPCSDRCSRPSVGRSHVSCAPSILIEIWAGRARSSRPLGPSTVTWFASIRTLTPLGTGMGNLPILDMATAFLPHVCEHFAADAGVQRLPPAHHTLAGGQDRDAQAAQHPRDLSLAGVDAQAGTADALHARDYLLAVAARLQGDLQVLTCVPLGLLHVVAGDVALVLEDARHL